MNRSYARRDFMRIGALGVGGLGLADVLRLEAAQKNYVSKEGPAKSVIQIYLPGGCAHQESWDPKPEAPLEYRGPFGVVKTKLPGIVFSENMKQTAKIADKIAVIRSMAGKEADHGRGTYAMWSGYRMSPALKHPAIGAVVNHEFGARAGLPGYIAIPRPSTYGGVGYLSPRFGAFGVGSDPGAGNFSVRDLTLPNGVDAKRFAKRRKLRDVVDAHFKSLETDRTQLDAMDSFYQQAYTMLSSKKVRDAFDLSAESDVIKKRYGLGQYKAPRGGTYGSQAGMRFLLARRLVEAGARFVSVTYAGWDDHERIRENMTGKMPAFDQAFATLINDLEERGLLDSTLVWVGTEFGRTPKINSSAGRDHYARVFSVAMAGGGLKRGIVHGASNATASEPARNAVSIPDLHTTIHHQIGINADKELMAPGARPIEIVQGGKVVKELIG